MSRQVLRNTGFRSRWAFVLDNNRLIPQSEPVRGRLTGYLEGWMKITSDRWILRIVRKRLKVACFNTETKRRKKRRIQFVLPERRYFSQNKRLLRKASNRFSSQSSRRAGVLRYFLFSCQEERRVPPYYKFGKWTRRHEFKSWPRLIAFPIALISLGKV